MSLCSCQFFNDQKGILMREIKGVLISNGHYTDSHSQRDHEYEYNKFEQSYIKLSNVFVLRLTSHRQQVVKPCQVEPLNVELGPQTNWCPHLKRKEPIGSKLGG